MYTRFALGIRRNIHYYTSYIMDLYNIRYMSNDDIYTKIFNGSILTRKKLKNESLWNTAAKRTTRLVDIEFQTQRPPRRYSRCSCMKHTSHEIRSRGVTTRVNRYMMRPVLPHNWGPLL